MYDQTYMLQEIKQIPEATNRLLEDSANMIAASAGALREKDPEFLITIARGSSDHAATFIKYSVELIAKRAVASIGPSLASIYGGTVKLDKAAAIAISQSGKSPDIVAMARSARTAGAVTIALTNTPQSPLASAAERAIDIQAGAETAVAATKSFVNSVVAGLALLAGWVKDEQLIRALTDLPEHFEKAIKLDWSEFTDPLKASDSIYILGRGPSLAIASEAALKFKETSNMHAEAFSSAEVLHGPVALVERGFPVLALAARDAAERPTADIADSLARRGALAFSTSQHTKHARALPFVATGHPLTDSLALIPPFYVLVEAFSRSKGFDPDKPAALKKVTETL